MRVTRAELEKLKGDLTAMEVEITHEMGRCCFSARVEVLKLRAISLQRALDEAIVTDGAHE